MKTKKIIPLPKLKEKAQSVVNKAVRERDKELGCICFGCNGKVEHASHYFSQGQHSALRYNTDNLHGSCLACNVYKHGNLIRYRQGLVKRYGEDYVRDLEALEAISPKVKKWCRDELEDIILKHKT